MKTIGLVLLLLYLGLTTGDKLKCHACQARDATYCNGTIVECPEGSQCMTVTEKFECNHTYHSIEKRCSLNLNCTHHMYAYVDKNINYELSYHCCDEDFCNNGTVKMRNYTYPFNGPECPICGSLDRLEMCDPVGHTICRRATDQCATLVAWVIIPGGNKTKFSVRGCMSEESCKLDYSQTVGYYVDEVIKAECNLPEPND